MSALREQALSAYRRGALQEAVSVQRRAISARMQSAEIDDFLLLGLYLHANRQFGEATSALKEGLARYPESPQLRENLGICLIAEAKLAEGVAQLQRALALGSQSTNVLDALCRALAGLGRNEEAIGYGRKSLELKDARFGAAPPLVTIPDGPPPPFNPSYPGENVISYGLWGANPRYIVPLLENLRIRNHLFPAWTIRCYVDRSVPERVRAKLKQDGVDLRLLAQTEDEPPARKLLWRFKVLDDVGVKRFLVRDADSLLTIKERVAVDEWTRSSKYFHLVRDFHTHTDLVLAGLWGGVGGVLPPLHVLLERFKPWRLENDHVDQDLLTVTAWPTIRRSCLIHDSVFTGCLGSVPFPPYGELPKGHHIGQNAFIHFKPTK